MNSKNHILTTYLNLRMGIVIFTCLLPLLLIGYGFMQDIGLQNSLSAYYHASPEGIMVPEKVDSLYKANPQDAQLKEIVNGYPYAYYHTQPRGQLLRTIFVSFLIAIGSFLYLYKGYSNKENIALNMAGGFATLVALFPMAWNHGNGESIFSAMEFWVFSVHGAAAVLLVFCVAYVCIFCSSDTLVKIEDEKIKNRFRVEYKVLGTLMIALPLFIFGYLSIIGKKDKLVLWIEIIVLLAFARFWWTKSKEISKIDPKLL